MKKPPPDTLMLTRVQVQALIPTLQVMKACDSEWRTRELAAKILKHHFFGNAAEDAPVAIPMTWRTMGHLGPMIIGEKPDRRLAALKPKVRRWFKCQEALDAASLIIAPLTPGRDPVPAAPSRSPRQPKPAPMGLPPSASA